MTESTEDCLESSVKQFSATGMPYFYPIATQIIRSHLRSYLGNLASSLSSNLQINYINNESDTHASY